MRPAAKVLLEFTNHQTFMSDEILASQAVYAVYYRGKPISIKTSHTYNPAFLKYKKTSFPNSGHAHGLAKKLNHQFNTDEFAVYKLTGGELVVKD